MKVTTVRLPSDLYIELTNQAKKRDLSKNQIIKIALRKLFFEEKRISNERRWEDEK